MKPTTIRRELGAISHSKRADKNYQLESHIELWPFGKMEGSPYPLHMDLVHPCVAEYFLPAVVTADDPANPLTRLLSFDGLLAAVKKLKLLNGRRKVWWVDPFSRFEVTSISGLQEFLRTVYDFPDACWSPEDRENASRWLRGESSVRPALSLKQPKPVQQTEDDNMAERSSRLKLSRIDLIREFNASYIASNFQSAIDSAARIQLVPSLRIIHFPGYEGYASARLHEADMFLLEAARAQEPVVTIAKVPNFKMFGIICDELDVFNGCRPVCWLDSEEGHRLLNDFSELGRLKLVK